MPKLLEVIVTSVSEAIEAEAGGADRLELVRSLEVGGLSPSADLVREVLAAVSIPVRVMLRETPAMYVSDAAELSHLKRSAGELADLAIDGLVLGFIRDGAIDLATTRELIAAAGDPAVTFHRAFDEVPEPLTAIAQLKTIPQVDRILSTGGEGSWHERQQRLADWQRAAAPNIKILVGAGTSSAALSVLKDADELSEVHIGRRARLPQAVWGAVHRQQVAGVKNELR